MIKRLKKTRIIWVIEAVPRLLWAAYRLRNKSTNWLQRQLSRSVIASDAANDINVSIDQQDWLKMHESVRLASRLLPGQLACLPRSLVLAAMLQKRGVSAKLELGVEKQSNTLFSHAWVSVDGKMVGEAQRVASDFNVLQDYKK